MLAELDAQTGLLYVTNYSSADVSVLNTAHCNAGQTAGCPEQAPEVACRFTAERTGDRRADGHRVRAEPRERDHVTATQLTCCHRADKGGSARLDNLDPTNVDHLHITKGNGQRLVVNVLWAL